MKVEPDWSFAPDWAQWWGVDEYGYAFWFDDAPEPGDENVWEQDGKWCAFGRVQIAGRIMIPGGISSDDVDVAFQNFYDYPNWKQSLRRRPQ